MEPEEPFIDTPSDSHRIPLNEGPLAAESSSSETASDGAGGNATPSCLRWISGLRHSLTAPAISLIRDRLSLVGREVGADSPVGFLKRAFFLLLAYLSVGVLMFSVDRQGFSGVKTLQAVDALYFCIVTMCTVGYGDIAPLNPATKLFSCVFVLIGSGLVDMLLKGALNYVLEREERMVLANANAASCIFDAEKRCMRNRVKMGLAIGVAVLCIGSGTLALCLLEEMDWMDALYLSAMSVATVGYGDRSFKTMRGRIFASFWLPVSTLAVALASRYLAEPQFDKMRRVIGRMDSEEGPDS